MPLFRKKFTVTIVCRNNMTRSAYLDALLNHILKTDRPDARRKLKILSAGIMASKGNSANGNIVFAARQRGIDMRRHRARPVDAKLVEKSDLLLTMSDRQSDWILERFPGAEGKVFRLMEYGWQGEPENGESLNMPDPTGRDASAFQQFIDLADAEAQRLLHELGCQGIL